METSGASKPSSGFITSKSGQDVDDYDEDENTSNVDKALEAVSGHRRYSMFLFVLMSLCIYNGMSSQALNYVFLGFVSPHHCRVPENISVDTAIPEDKHGELEKCIMFENYTQNASTVPCTDGWTYTPIYGEKTIIMEWDLVCDHNYMAELSQTLFSTGSLVGQMTAAMIIDRVGRKWVPVVCYVLIASLGCGLAFTQSILSFTIIRTAIAVCTAISWVAGATHVSELFSKKQRAFITMFFEYGWCMAYLYSGLVAYLLPDWRMMQLVYSLVPLVGVVSVIIPESPYWLVVNGRKKEAEKILQQMARYNNVKVGANLLGQDEDIPLKDVQDEGAAMVNSEEIVENGVKMEMLDGTKYKKPGEERFWDLLIDPLLRKSLMVTMAMFFSLDLLYYFTVFGVAEFGGNLYVSFVLGGITEFPGYALGFVISKRGRRLPASVSFLLACPALLALAFTPKQTASGVDLTPLIITFVLIIRLLNTIMYVNAVLFSKELFPTNLRGAALAMGVLMGCFGNMIAPFAIFVARETSWIPSAVMSGICLIMGLVLLRLPETQHWPLPQSIADVHRFTARRTGHNPRRNTEEDMQNAEIS